MSCKTGSQYLLTVQHPPQDCGHELSVTVSQSNRTLKGESHNYPLFQRNKEQHAKICEKKSMNHKENDHFLEERNFIFQKSNSYSQDSNTNPFSITGVVDGNTVAI